VNKKKRNESDRQRPQVSVDGENEWQLASKHDDSDDQWANGWQSDMSLEKVKEINGKAVVVD
jgi:hypothetical protein